jgi:hypothetical protein
MAEINELIDRGLKEFYLRPKQMLKMARAIRTPDDLRRKLYGFRMFTDGWMLKRDLARQLKKH